MSNKKPNFDGSFTMFIVIITLCIFGYQAPMALGIPTAAKNRGSERTIIESLTTGKRSSILLAEKKEAASSAQKKRTYNPEEVKPEMIPDSKTGGKGKSRKPKAKPMKSFIPTEKIQAEQAVDFPVDI